MPRLFRHPEVQDYFETLDWSQDAGTLARAATAAYEAGRVIALSGVRIECDRQFLAGLQFSEQATKKFKSLGFLRNHRPGRVQEGAADPYAEILRETFGGDRGRMDRFAGQMQDVNAQVDAIVARAFPGYRIDKPSVTWRLNETINENLHVDVYNEDIPGHHLRVFANLDVVPRIWHTSHTLEYLLQHRLDLLERQFLRNATPGRICHALNFAVFKAFEEAGREGQPKHIVFFEPGEVWVVDSRKVSHQIFFGRKALSTEHVIALDSMADPSTHYYALVERHRERALAA